MPNNNLHIIPQGPELEAFIAHERNLDIAYLRKNMGISQENAEDIYAEAQLINEQRAAAEFEDGITRSEVRR